MKSLIFVFQLYAHASTHLAIRAVIQSLKTELTSRFSRVNQPDDLNFDPIYMLATLLDHRFCLLLEGALLDVAKKELILMGVRYE